MSTSSISRLAELKKLVAAQVEQGYSGSNESVRELIQKDTQNNLRLSERLRIGASSPSAVPADAIDFKRFRRLLRAKRSAAVMAKSAFPRELGSQPQVDDTLAHYLSEAGAHVALSCVDALEGAHRHISRRPVSRSSRSTVR